MLILTLRTDKPEAEIGLYEDDRQVAYQTWEAHRQLAETLHTRIEEMLKGHGKSLQDLGGIVCYKGPGSFTGLRIGLSVANALSYSFSIPMYGGSGTDWLPMALSELSAGRGVKAVMPEYGAPVHITLPKQ